MARIPEEEIERLKRETSVEELARARGIELKRHGADLIGFCQFHSDKNTPSLVITPAKNLWHCLGACQAGGSAIDWVMRAEGVSFRHAVELLRAGYPTGVAARPTHSASIDSTEATGRPINKPIKKSTVVKLESPFESWLHARPQQQADPIASRRSAGRRSQSRRPGAAQASDQLLPRDAQAITRGALTMRVSSDLS